MSHNLFKTLLFLGKICGAVPLSKNNKTKNVVLIAFLVGFHMYFIISTWITRVNNFHVLTHIITKILEIGLDISISCFSLQVILTALLKRKKWYILLKSLKIVKLLNPNNQALFFFYFLLYLFFEAFHIVTVSNITGFYALFTNYGYNYIQSLFIFYQLCLMQSIIVIFKNKCRVLLIQLEKETLKPKTSNLFVYKTKVALLSLIRDVALFNSLFGWIILNIVFVLVLKAELMFFFNLIVHTELNINTISAITLFFWAWIELIVMLLCFDSFHCEYNKIIQCIQKAAIEVGGDFKLLADDCLLEERPTLSAAAFFELKKSTLFNFLNFILTILIIIVQFKLGGL